MKRTLFFAIGALAAFSFKAAAQDIDYYTPETTEGVVYLLPKTMLEVYQDDVFLNEQQQ